MAVGEVILGIVGGGIGGTLISGLIAWRVGVLDFKGKREDRRERRFSELSDRGLELARSDDPRARAQGREMLRSLSTQGRFSELEARLAGDLWRMHAAEEADEAKVALESGKKVRFWKRVANRGQDG